MWIWDPKVTGLKFEPNYVNPVYRMMVDSALQWEKIASSPSWGQSQKVLGSAEGITHIMTSRQMGKTTDLKKLFLENSEVSFLVGRPEQLSSEGSLYPCRNQVLTFRDFNDEYRFRGFRRDSLKYIFIDGYSFCAPDLQRKIAQTIITLAGRFELEHVFIVD